MTRRWRKSKNCPIRLCSVVATGALVLAACTAEEATPPTVELSTTSTPITTEPTTTEPAPTEAPTTTEDPRIAEVEAAVVAFRETQVEVLTNPDAPLELLEEVAGGELLENLTRSIAMLRADGQTTAGEFRVFPVSTTVAEGGVASHVSCGQDGLAGFSAEGLELVAADGQAFLRRYELRQDGSAKWKVTSIEFEGIERTLCSAG